MHGLLFFLGHVLTPLMMAAFIYVIMSQIRHERQIAEQTGRTLDHLDPETAKIDAIFAMGFVVILALVMILSFLTYVVGR